MIALDFEESWNRRRIFFPALATCWGSELLCVFLCFSSIVTEHLGGKACPTHFISCYNRVHKVGKEIPESNCRNGKNHREVGQARSLVETVKMWLIVGATDFVIAL